MEELDEILGEINDEDQTLLAAGIGGVNEEDEDEALRLQEQLSRQRQQRDRTPPRPDAGMTVASVIIHEITLASFNPTRKPFDKDTGEQTRRFSFL